MTYSKYRKRMVNQTDTEFIKRYELFYNHISNAFDMRQRRATYHAFNANDPRFISVVHYKRVDFSYLDYPMV